MASKAPTARVLVVDDDPQERLGLSNMIAALGHTAESAEDGERALEKLGGGAFDAIITDLVMPGMDGFELLRGDRRSDASGGLDGFRQHRKSRVYRA